MNITSYELIGSTLPWWVYFWKSENRFEGRLPVVIQGRMLSEKVVNLVHQDHKSWGKNGELSTYRNNSSVGSRDFYDCSTLNDGNDFSCFWRTQSLLWNASCTSQRPMPTSKLDVLHLRWKYYQSCPAKWLMQMGMTRQVCSFDYERNLTPWVMGSWNQFTLLKDNIIHCRQWGPDLLTVLLTGLLLWMHNDCQGVCKDN
jgi:hypothetical protein